jgi:hypothetical protein
MPAIMAASMCGAMHLIPSPSPDAGSADGRQLSPIPSSEASFSQRWADNLSATTR